MQLILLVNREPMGTIKKESLRSPFKANPSPQSTSQSLVSLEF
jgi:hypothetical protein